MPLFTRLTIYAAVYYCLFFPAAGPLWAENKGQDDLGLATETKLAAENFSDLGEVVRLCESAMEKGLDAENTKFAKHLLAATLVQRAEVANKIIFAGGAVDPKWVDYRRLALEDLEKAVSLVPEEPEALMLIAKLNFLPGGDKKRAVEALELTIAMEDADTRIRAAALVLRAGTRKDGEKRMADVQEALRLEPKHPHTIEVMARLLAETKKYDRALEYLAKLQKLRPNVGGPLLLEARIHAVRSHMDKAVKCLDRALQLQPDNLDVLFFRARLYTALKQPEKALADIDRVLELKPDQERARRCRAMLLAKAGKINEVVDELKAILKAKPGDLNLQMQLAMLHAMLRQPKKAIDVYSKVLDKKPENVAALLGRASALLTIGKHAESIADYEKAAKLGADGSGMFNNFAWVLATSPDDKLRNGPRAVELATKACELTDYKQAHILSTLAAAHAETGDFKKAVKWSKKAIELGKKTAADKEIQEALAKELKSFDGGKPWRERLSEKDLKPPKIEAETPPEPEKPVTPDTPDVPPEDDNKKRNASPE